jgi:cytidylate kinase
MNYINVAIDGPAGAGKSTIAKLLAKKLNFVYVDTGAMYRAITYKALKLNIDITKDDVYNFLDETDIVLTPDDQVLIDDINVTLPIRESEVTSNVSTVSSKRMVRDKLVTMQRDMARKQNVIMDGRDIGSNVLKDAQVKIYLTASVEERARRRYLELLKNKNESEVSFENIKDEIQKRDYQDSSRELNPLKQAEDAILVDTSNFTIDEVIETLIEIILGSVNIHE